jgi:hypothetical protein
MGSHLEDERERDEAQEDEIDKLKKKKLINMLSYILLYINIFSS